MSEQKVWVKKMPESCFECPIMVDGSEGCDFCVCAILEEKATTKNRLKDCPLKSLHEHDKELVVKVLEKFKTFVRENTYICGGNATREDIITSSSYNQALRDVLGFMQTLQKEYEK